MSIRRIIAGSSNRALAHAFRQFGEHSIGSFYLTRRHEIMEISKGRLLRMQDNRLVYCGTASRDMEDRIRDTNADRTYTGAI